jgi:Viral BACON domain
VSWLVPSPSRGRLNSEVSKQVSIVFINNKAPVSADGTVTFTLGHNSTTVHVRLLQSAPTCPTTSNCLNKCSGICLDPKNLSFEAVEGQGGQRSQQLAISSSSTVTPSSQTVTPNSQNANWSASVSIDVDKSWLKFNPSQGSLDNDGNASASVEVNSAELSAGVYQGSITITLAGTLETATASVILVVTEKDFCPGSVPACAPRSPSKSTD